MKKITFVLFMSLFVVNVQAQYQKMSKANTLNLSAFDSFYHVGWGKQFNNKTTFSVSGFYFDDDSRALSIDNYSGNIGINYWVIKVENFYFSVGGGLFFTQTHAESIAQTKDNDLSGGFEIKAEAEFYLTWWAILFGELKQLKYFDSDYYNSKFVPGIGFKVVF